MRLHALQYLRAIASLAVVYSHTVIQVESYFHRLPEFGSFGVDIFFVISGFIMVYIARPTDTPVSFFLNRVRRVVPLYWFFTLLMAAILLLVPGVFKTTVFDLSALLRSLAFIPHFSVAQPAEVWPIVAPGWSLNYEVYFYLLFALSLLFAPRFRIAFITLMILAVFSVANLVSSSTAITIFYSQAIVFEFVFGMLLAVSWKRGFSLSPRVGMLLIAAGFVLLFLRLPLPRIAEFGIPSLMIVAGCLYVRVAEQKILVLLGDASYALYLCHIFALGVLRKVLPPILGDGPAAPLLFVVISLLFCTIISILVHLLVDNWLLRRERFTSLRLLRRSETTELSGKAR